MVLSSVVFFALLSGVSATSDCNVADGGHAMLQMARAREAMAVGAESGDTSSLLAMKAQLKSKIERGEALTDQEKEFFQDFMNFLINTSLKNINETHESDQNELNTAAEAIQSCNQQLSDNQGHGPWFFAVSNVSYLESHHLECRQNESTLWPATNQSCTSKLDWETSRLTPPQTVYPGVDAWNASSMIDWLDEFHHWHCVSNHSGDFETESQNCMQHSATALGKRGECNNVQKSYETNYCNMKTVKGHACSTLDTCFDTNRGFFETLKADKIADNEFLKVEYRIVKTIICYIGLLMEGDAAMTEERKSACEIDWPYPFLELVMPANVTKLPCANATSWPCQAAWVEGAYNGLPALAPAHECMVACGI